MLRWSKRGLKSSITYVDAAVIPAGKTVTRSVNRTPSGESLNVLFQDMTTKVGGTDLQTQSGELTNGRDISNAEAVHPAYSSGDIDLLFGGEVGNLTLVGSARPCSCRPEGEVCTNHIFGLVVSSCPCGSKVWHDLRVVADQRRGKGICCGEYRGWSGRGRRGWERSEGIFGDGQSKRACFGCNRGSLACGSRRCGR